MKFAIIIPAYQASKTIIKLLNEIEKVLSTLNEDVSVIVINDGSTDGILQQLQNYPVEILSHQINLGKGTALKTGFEYAIKNNFDAVITLDADLQHDPIYIKKFIQEYKRNYFDLIIGNRIDRIKQMPFSRQLSNLLTSFILSAKTGIDIPDSQSGYRIISTKILKSITLEQTDYTLETEMLIKAAKLKFRVGSIPISTIYNNQQSHIKNWKTIFNFLKLIFKD
ncbi:MAG: glycosyltransferase family 2 protein [Bacteroidetes bacterium]|nr:glycosyltransferase family 2 protein [Bacteroidota bacterium]